MTAPVPLLRSETTCGGMDHDATRCMVWDGGLTATPRDGMTMTSAVDMTTRSSASRRGPAPHREPTGARGGTEVARLGLVRANGSAPWV